MLTTSPGSLGLYAPGNDTRFGLYVADPPLTWSWAHEMYSWAPPGLLALWRATCSTRRKYSPSSRHLGIWTLSVVLPAVQVSVTRKRGTE